MMKRLTEYAKDLDLLPFPTGQDAYPNMAYKIVEKISNEYNLTELEELTLALNYNDIVENYGKEVPTIYATITTREDEMGIRFTEVISSEIIEKIKKMINPRNPITIKTFYMTKENKLFKKNIKELEQQYKNVSLDKIKTLFDMTKNEEYYEPYLQLLNGCDEEIQEIILEYIKPLSSLIASNIEDYSCYTKYYGYHSSYEAKEKLIKEKKLLTYLDDKKQKNDKKKNDYFQNFKDIRVRINDHIDEDFDFYISRKYFQEIYQQHYNRKYRFKDKENNNKNKTEYLKKLFNACDINILEDEDLDEYNTFQGDMCNWNIWYLKEIEHIFLDQIDLLKKIVEMPNNKEMLKNLLKLKILFLKAGPEIKNLSTLTPTYKEKSNTYEVLRPGISKYPIEITETIRYIDHYIRHTVVDYNEKVTEPWLKQYRLFIKTFLGEYNYQRLLEETIATINKDIFNMIQEIKGSEENESGKNYTKKIR